MAPEDERIALFLDYENLAIGARDGLGVSPFDFGPVADALAERGRVVTRRAYADWSSFDEDRRLLARAQVELIEIPQRIGGSRKNAADIKMAVDAIELAYEREFVTTFAIGTGDSDFTPLMHKLREMDKRVIGIGVQSSTSALLPAACDEFLFYDRLPGVPEVVHAPRSNNGGKKSQAKSRGRESVKATATEPKAEASTEAKAEPRKDRERSRGASDLQELQRTITQTLAGLKQSGSESVYASTLKRALLRKDPTFSEGDYGFRAFGEMLRQMERNGAVALTDGQAPGDPGVDFAEPGKSEDTFDLLKVTVQELQGEEDEVPLSGLKDQLRKRNGKWSEKDFGYAGFLQFAKAAAAAGVVIMEWDDEEGDYFLWVGN
jgi:uncharacterized LabA/DUF88 family protein